MSVLELVLDGKVIGRWNVKANVVVELELVLDGKVIGRWNVKANVVVELGEPWSDGTLFEDGTGWLGPQDIGGSDAPTD